MHAGYNTRSGSTRMKKHFAGFVSGLSWINSQKARAATAAFLGTDYNRSLYGVNLSNGMCEQMVKSFMTARTVEQQNEYLGKLELTQRFSTTGSSAQPPVSATSGG